MKRAGAAGVRRRDMLLTAAVSLVAIAAVLLSLSVSPGVHGVLGAGLALLMLAIAVIDAHSFIIPDELTAAALALALVNAAMQDPSSIMEGVIWSAVRGAALAACFLAVRSVYELIRGRQGIGLGDVKLAAVAGAWLEWTTMPIAVEIAALAALGGYALRQVVGRRPVRATGRLPFGLFLAPAIWLCWVLETTVL
ncbi:MAG TPA: A24 family peptidase [Xanthobacteraceae bacterium]|nr:A24 family peptidase [Xanthobacteraceae bacterium]